jgi:hypothetical protein
VLFALGSIDLFKAEELPVDGEPSFSANRTNPQRGLIRPRTHNIKVEVDAAWCLHELTLGSHRKICGVG